MSPFLSSLSLSPAVALTHILFSLIKHQMSGELLESKDGLHWCFVLGEVGLYLLASGAEVGETIVSNVIATRHKLLGARHPLTAQVEIEAKRLAAGP